MAMSPPRYCFSSTLLLPRKERIMRFTCPALVRIAKPPLPSIPALLDTAVSECSDSFPLALRALIRVSAHKKCVRQLTNSTWDKTALQLT